MDDLTRLAVAAQSGRAEDIAALVRASYRDVWTFCSHLVDPASADDLAQETQLRVFRALPSFRGEASARTWILAIARRTCMDELRSRTRRRAREALHPAPGDDLLGTEEPDHSEVRHLLGLLPIDQRVPFALTQVLGMTYDETATVCACPPGTVRSRVARARTELLAHLRPGGRGHHPDRRGGPETTSTGDPGTDLPHHPDRGEAR